MKRLHLFIAAVIAAVIAIPTAAVSAAPADSVHGPPCANIEVSGFAYSTFTGPRTVSGTLGVEQQDPSCSSVTYTVYVYSADGNTLLGSEEFVGDGVWTEQLFSISPSPAPDVICLYAESTMRGRLVDRAPNERCTTTNQLTINGGVGATDFR